MKLLFKFWTWAEESFPTTEFYIEARDPREAKTRKKLLIKLINDYYKTDYNITDFTNLSAGIPWNHLGEIEYFTMLREFEPTDFGHKPMEAILFKLNSKIVELFMV